MFHLQFSGLVLNTHTVSGAKASYSMAEVSDTGSPLPHAGIWLSHDRSQLPHAGIRLPHDGSQLPHDGSKQPAPAVQKTATSNLSPPPTPSKAGSQLALRGSRLAIKGCQLLGAGHLTVAKFLVPDRKDIVDSGIGLSYRPTRLHLLSPVGPVRQPYA